MPDFLLELRCEEIPARMQAGACDSLKKLFAQQMLAAGVSHGEVSVWSTPRRLALIARELPAETAAVREELKGPKVTAPEQALAGFLRKSGVARESLEDRGGTWFAVSEKPGRATNAVLAAAIPAIIRAFPWPKSMRWGAASLSTESLRWVRPLSGIVAILGEELVPCEVGGVASGYATLGHRFHHPGAITIGGASDYQEKLRACHVIVDHAEREALIRERVAQVAAAANVGLVPIDDEALVIENAGLTEWPVPLLGTFDASFLELPPEVIQLTARINQKYFVCNGRDGTLSNVFVCTANIEAADGGAAIVAGNRKVLTARLADARFFWSQDRGRDLAEHAEKLKDIVFHEKLGTVADKVERVAKLAEWLASEGIVPNCNPKLAEQAARLCKADLVTAMVGEFPELQGVMGGYYARADELNDEVADAIRDHYKPVGQGDEVPTAPVTVAVSLADKLDTIAGFFATGEKPTGSKDPFALRRSAVAVLSLCRSNSISMPFRFVAKTVLEGLGSVYKGRVIIEGALDKQTIAEHRRGPVALWMMFNQQFPGVIPEGAFPPSSVEEFSAMVDADVGETVDQILEFLIDRLKVQQREAGVRHDLIDAVFALGGEDDLVRLLARVHALQAFVTGEDGANLLVAYKRAANILRKENYVAPGAPHPENAGAEGEGVVPPTGEEDPLVLVDDPEFRDIAAEFAHSHEQPRNLLSYTPEPAESALFAALDAAEPRAREAVADENFAGAMAALASLRGPIDAFFDHVTVNDADPARRSARLALLARFRDAVHQVADFSKIEG